MMIFHCKIIQGCLLCFFRRIIPFIKSGFFQSRFFFHIIFICQCMKIVVSKETGPHQDTENNKNCRIMKGNPCSHQSAPTISGKVDPSLFLFTLLDGMPLIHQCNWCHFPHSDQWKHNGDHTADHHNHQCVDPRRNSHGCYIHSRMKTKGKIYPINRTHHPDQ